MKDDNDTPEKRIENFWKEAFRSSTEEKMFLKDLSLPLARIKRLMKIEEGVRMVASEVPIMFSKIAEKFIEELTLRAWTNTEENKRRILQKSDISVAVRTSEMFDFLVYIVPRNDMSHSFDKIVSNKSIVDTRHFIAPRPHLYRGQNDRGEYFSNEYGGSVNNMDNEYKDA